jgi:hypothetical protein
METLIQVNVSGFKVCPALLETVGIRVPNNNFRNFPCLPFFPRVKFVPLLHLHQPKIPFANILTRQTYGYT